MDTAPGFGLVTTRDNFEKNKKIVEAVGRMYTKASVFRAGHRPSRSADPVRDMAADGAAEPRAQGRDRGQRQDHQGRFSYWIPSQAGVKPGRSGARTVQPYLKAMADWEMIPGPVKFDDFVTNELIPAINNFDQDAVKK